MMRFKSKAQSVNHKSAYFPCAPIFVRTVLRLFNNLTLDGYAAVARVATPVIIVVTP
jgi:hypothetical protein